MKRIRTSLVVLGAAGLVAAIGACLPLGQGRQVRLAIVDWPAYEYFYLASRKGLDRQEHYRLQVDQFGSLQDQRRAFNRGDVEAIATTLPEAIAICREVPARCPEIVLVLDESHGADHVVAAARWRSLAQLKGQRLGLERSVLGDFMVLSAVGGQGLGLSDFQLRYDGPKALVAQLQRGNLEAIVTYAPHSDPLLSDPRWRVLFSSSEIPGEVVDVLAVSPDLRRRDPALVKGLVRSWWAARRLAAEQPHDATALMAQRQGVTPAQFLQSQRLIRYPDRSQQAALLAPQGPVQRTLERLHLQMRQANRLPQASPLPQLAPELVP